MVVALTQVMAKNLPFFFFFTKKTKKPKKKMFLSRLKRHLMCNILLCHSEQIQNA